MKDLNDIVIPGDRKFAEDHEWTKYEDGTVRIGISDYAQDQLGDIVYVELPEVGATLSKGQSFGVVESVKSVSDLFMPVSGEVIEVNETLADEPELVNKSPYDEGWMLVVKPSETSELYTLMTPEVYRDKLKGAE